MEQLSNLERRVEALGKHIGDIKKGENISSQLSRLQREADSLLMSHINAGFIAKYQTFKKFLDCQDPKKLLLHTLRKAEIIINYETEIRKSAEMLREIDNLKRYLDFEPLHSKIYVDVEDKARELRTLELENIQATVQVGEANKVTTELLEAYSDSLFEISDQLIEWEGKINSMSKSK